MSQSSDERPSNRLTDRLGQAAEQGQRMFTDISRTLGRTAASASELLSDAELRRKGRILLVHEASKGIREIQQKVGSAAGNLGRSLQQGAGTLQRGIFSGPKQLQGALERIKQKVNEARLKSLLEMHNQLTVDVQIAEKLYEDAPQEIRSRLWAALIQNPSFEPIRFNSNRHAQDQKILNLIDEPVPEEDEGWELLDSPFTANKSRIKEGCPYSMTLETLLEAMSRVEWPLNDEVHQDSNYGTLIQITVGQDEIDEIIRRDLHRTFPELPQFNFPEKRNALFNILKAYSLYDLEVGYCQGMGFVAGILLLYLPEEWSFQMFCLLMKEDQVNLRRFYVPGLEPLQRELWKLEYLLEKHLPILDAHLKENCVTSMLYASQWFLTCFSCPFTEFFSARVLDIMMLEKSCDPLIRTAFAVLVQLGEELLQLNNFEDILTHIKVKPLSWDITMVRQVLSAVLQSPITAEEIQKAEAEYFKLRSDSGSETTPDLIPDLDEVSDQTNEDIVLRRAESRQQSLEMILSMDLLLDLDVPDQDPITIDKPKQQ